MGNKDTIYRQEAIDALCNDFCGGHQDCKYYPKCENLRSIQQLPSAQPEPCDDPRADIYYLAEKIGIHRLYALVVELRGEPEPCKDAVSREKVFEYFVSLWECIGTIMDRDEWEDVCKTTANELPSAQPERDCMLKQFGKCSYDETGCSDCKIKAKIRTALTAQPEQRWIPVTEKLPDMHDAGIFKKLGIKQRSDKVYITIEPERKRGRWETYLISMIDGEGCRCSECGFEGVPYWEFCPNCGADMREGEAE